MPSGAMCYNESIIQGPLAARCGECGMSIRYKRWKGRWLRAGAVGSLRHHGRRKHGWKWEWELDVGHN